MNGAHIHLIVCHLPIMGAGFTLLLILFSLLKKSKDLKQVSLWFAVITGLSALGVYLTGDGAEDIVKSVLGTPESVIEVHESWALYFMIALLVIASVSLAGLFLSRASVPVLHRFVIIVFVLLLLSSFLAFETGLTGGKIRHSETDTTEHVIR
jgi:hypothetical protein